MVIFLYKVLFKLLKGVDLILYKGLFSIKEIGILLILLNIINLKLYYYKLFNNLIIIRKAIIYSKIIVFYSIRTKREVRDITIKLSVKYPNLLIVRFNI